MKVLRRILPAAPLKQDLIAGATVALVLIPQSLAYAQLAGMPVQFGLYAALVAPVVGALFGSSKQLSTGPVAILSVMTAAALTPLAAPGTEAYISLAILLAFALGCFQVLMGLLKLGGLVSLLSHPVVYGFTNAAAIIIATTQLSTFFGVKVGPFAHHYETVWAVLETASRGFAWHTAALGITVLLFMAILKRLRKRMPVILVVVVLSTALSASLGYDGAVVGAIPLGLPMLRVPVIDLSTIAHLSVNILTMALIGFTESISVAQAIAVKTKNKLRPNRELIGQGLANIIGSFFQSYPTAGSFSRTAVNFQAGAQSAWSSVFTSGMVFIALLLLTPYLHYLPQVVLGAVIIYSVTGLVDFKKIVHIWQSNKFDAVAAILTFVGTLYTAPHLETGVILGILFSLGHYVYRNAHPRVAFVSKYRDGQYRDAERFKMKHCENIAIVRLDASLFFANSAYFEEQVIDYLAKHRRVKYVVVVGSGINEIDSSGEEAIVSLYETLKASRKDLYFSELKGDVRDVFVTTGLFDRMGEDHFFNTTRDAVETLVNSLNASHSHSDASACPLSRYIMSDDGKEIKTVDIGRPRFPFYFPVAEILNADKLPALNFDAVVSKIRALR